MEDKSDLSWKTILTTIGAGVVIALLLAMGMKSLGMEINTYVIGGITGLLVGGKLGWAVRKTRIERMKKEKK